MANFVPSICGTNKVHLPVSGCTDCEKLEARVKALEDLVAKTVTISKSDRAGSSISVTVIGEVNE